MTRNKRQYVFYFFALSLLLHLLFVYLARLPAPAPQARIFYQQRTTFFDPIKPYRSAKPYQPPTEMQRIAAPTPTLSPEEAELLNIPLADLAPTLPPLPDLPDTILVPGKSTFRAPTVALADLNAIADSALQQKIEARETFARIYFDDADTTDEESRNRRRAEAIVERAIRAMGGRAALLAITQMRARVWLEAWENVIEQRPAPIILNVSTYLYPIAAWQYRGFDFYTNKPITVKPSFDPNIPNPPYLTYNPAISRDRYYRLFEHRWLFFGPRLRTLRQQGEVARWHFLDRFLGDGIILGYIGTEHIDRQATDVIRVDDRRYGHYFEAFFSRETGLLSATREGLVLAERHRYIRRYKMRPPTWTTTYTKYRPVHNALFPHRLTRSGPSCPHCLGQAQRSNRTVEVTIQLQLAANGDEPTIESPDLEY